MTDVRETAPVPVTAHRRRAAIQRWVRDHRHDIAIAIVLFAAAAVAVWIQTRLLDPRIVDPGTGDVWFDGDVRRVVENMTDRWSNHFRARVHPIFALLVLPAGMALHRIAGLAAFDAASLVSSGIAGLWIAAFYAFCRLLGVRRLDAVIGCVLAATTAAAMFWFAVPETHALGSLSVLVPIVFAAASRDRRRSALLATLVSLFSLGITVTNWVAGLLAALIRRPWRSALQISVNAFFAIVVLSGLARVLIPSSGQFLSAMARETGYVLAPEARGAHGVFRSLYSHSVVMPAIEVVDLPGAGEWPAMITQPARAGSTGALGLTAAAIWFLLFALGMSVLIVRPPFPAFRWFLLLLIASQTFVYLTFGGETFLYSPNMLPLLMAVAVLPLLTAARPVALALMCALIGVAGVNNVAQWRNANHMFARFENMSHSKNAEMRRRPDDPWPRLERTVQIGQFGRRLSDVGMHRLGGSFSPGLNKFNVSFWVLDADGAIHATADDIEAASILESVSAQRNSGVESIRTITPYYRTTWTYIRQRKFRLDLNVLAAPSRFAMTIRSVGPQRGPIRSLAWDGHKLHVNGRWTVRIQPAPISVYIGREGTDGWITATSADRSFGSPSGWGWARIELAARGSYVITVEDTDASGPIDRHIATLR